MTKATAFLLATPILALLCPLAARSQDASIATMSVTDRQFAIGSTLRYDLVGGGLENFAPRLSLRGQKMLWEDAEEVRGLALHVGSTFSAERRPSNRIDFTQNLLLANGLSIAAGLAHQWSVGKGHRVVGPDAGVEANFVPWRGDTLTHRVRFNGGLACSMNNGLTLSLYGTRTVNGLGASDKARFLTATGRPWLWATSLSTSAGYYSRPRGLQAYATFAAFLGDSKFHVPPEARRALTFGIEKDFDLGSRPEQARHGRG